MKINRVTAEVEGLVTQAVGDKQEREMKEEACRSCLQGENFAASLFVPP